ncbi:glycine cleavage system aminomethyltransferase GcvT [Macrococcoides caseolyticum]|uniref:glycine cleavage system aminomethyltransferase GcvT n=1 Tax=Macrococcoides caseolyticum TaxID=69966 RepID=UPI0005A1A38B|nr:glycine cleavage system aminomethyltransferase GcvT [Macrococcus caseolyticus]PKD98976.1 glycine cleavage system protein T [Macrococcus caseolyticus]PKE07743.1 glycine cleavage system protein T [Macrococcus caseolyticus]PKE20266.1 glycine cleavage system protein T [Macrococcus caseolyticus]PKE24871.1 glycine cleavage system protein T [Macrococcus caseolyticus]PKE54400.1 glycine cleavage system protein T [Macrococcus caseolyticus]
MMSELKRTPLYEKYLEDGAKVIDFSGWALPVQFSSIKEEHIAVREDIGMFDVSHMGEIIVEGEHALEYLQYVLTNDASKMTDKKAQYTMICNEDGGVVDDLVVYKLEENKYLLVVNAGNTDIDFEWLKSHKKDGVTITNVSSEYGQIAVQGPKTLEKLAPEVKENISEMKLFEFLKDVEIFGKNVILSQSGYTGEYGFEIYCKAEDTLSIWEALLNLGITPCGLGARDTLRLEAALPLHGQDLSTEITPYEAKMGFSVKLDKGNFIGKSVLETQKLKGVNRKSAGIELLERGIARTDYEVFDKEDNKIGYITSGTQSPLTGRSIALALINTDFTAIDTEVYVQVRKKRIPAKVVKTPFHKN